MWVAPFHRLGPGMNEESEREINKRLCLCVSPVGAMGLSLQVPAIIGAVN